MLSTRLKGLCACVPLQARVTKWNSTWVVPHCSPAAGRCIKKALMRKNREYMP